MKFVFWIVTLPILALVGAFAAANHRPVTVSLWPFPYEVELPTYGAVLGAFALGFLVAALWVWAANLPSRMARRRLARQEKKLEDEVATLRAQLVEARNEAGRGPAVASDPDAARRAMIARSD